MLKALKGTEAAMNGNPAAECLKKQPLCAVCQVPPGFIAAAVQTPIRAPALELRLSRSSAILNCREILGCCLAPFAAGGSYKEILCSGNLFLLILF